MYTLRILPLGDTALTVEFGNAIDPEINEQVRSLHELLAKGAIGGVVESVPTYRSLLVYYRPEEILYDRIVPELQRLAASLEGIPRRPGETVEIPVLYGGEWGPDLGFVAVHTGLSADEVVRIHSAGRYRVYMLGFAPGFPYLGGMDKAIAAPRLETPRLEIPAGSVGIAGEQTGVYPLASPGGWRLIGRTPLRLYDSRREEPVLLRVGQIIRFRSIDRAEYDGIAEREAKYGRSG